VGGVRPCDDEDPGGIAVEPVDDPRTGNSPDPGQSVGARKERVHEGSPGMPRRGVNHHPGRFFDDQKVSIFVKHTDRKILRHQFEGNGRRDHDDQGLSALQASRGTHDLPRQPDVPLPDQPLSAGPGDPRDRLRKVPVEAFPRPVGRNRQPVRPCQPVRRHATRSSKGCVRSA
jgi:hypothetical protein